MLAICYKHQKMMHKLLECKSGRWVQVIFKCPECDNIVIIKAKKLDVGLYD